MVQPHSPAPGGGGRCHRPLGSTLSSRARPPPTSTGEGVVQNRNVSGGGISQPAGPSKYLDLPVFYLETRAPAGSQMSSCPFSPPTPSFQVPLGARSLRGTRAGRTTSLPSSYFFRSHRGTGCKRRARGSLPAPRPRLHSWSRVQNSCVSSREPGDLDKGSGRCLRGTGPPALSQVFPARSGRGAFAVAQLSCRPPPPRLPHPPVSAPLARRVPSIAVW